MIFNEPVLLLISFEHSKSVNTPNVAPSATSISLINENVEVELDTLKYKSKPFICNVLVLIAVPCKLVS